MKQSKIREMDWGGSDDGDGICHGVVMGVNRAGLGVHRERCKLRVTPESVSLAAAGGGAASGRAVQTL